MQEKITTKKLRSFGFMVAAMFALIALWPAVARASGPRPWALIAALCFFLLAVFVPAALVYIYRPWMAYGRAMGWINTRILLGIVFYTVVTPLGLLRRRSREDPMGRRLRPDLESYRVPRSPRPAPHFRRQY